MDAFWNVPSSDETVFRANLEAINRVLLKTHGLPLSERDVKGVEVAYRAFYWFGPSIHYTSSQGPPVGGGVSYAELMKARDDASGQERSYLASEEGFAFLKALESKNLVVPVVGDFAGPKALRGVGKYLADRGAVVSAFYVSNVESYLRRNAVWPAFCANVATWPLDEASLFIRPSGLTRLAPIASEVASCRAP
jgi:hypothetical protein